MPDTPPFSLLIIGAHPDDCEFAAGGFTALCRRAGQPVTFVSLTNGDAGHHQLGGAPLARRRLAETQAVARDFGLTYHVLDHHDGELEPTLAVRQELIALIRRAAPDLILGHRVNDYHPDHRASAQLTLDAAYLAGIPNILPTVTPLARRPSIAYLQDDFQRPTPFRPDLVIDITAVQGDKARMLHAHPSQVYEWLPFIEGRPDRVPTGDAERLAWVSGAYLQADTVRADLYRAQLSARYGDLQAARAQAVEAFEVSEYGAPWSAEQEARLEPILTGRA